MGFWGFWGLFVICLLCFGDGLFSFDSVTCGFWMVLLRACSRTFVALKCLVWDFVWGLVFSRVVLWLVVCGF